MPENIAGEKTNIKGPFSRFTSQPMQVGTNADFADVKLDWATLLLLKKDGTIYCNNVNLYDRVLLLWGRIWKLSQHSDWVAIERHDWNQAGIAFAADGTLAAWPDPRGSHQLLGPSRKPLWTLNIFAENN